MYICKYIYVVYIIICMIVIYNICMDCYRRIAMYNIIYIWPFCLLLQIAMLVFSYFLEHCKSILFIYMLRKILCQIHCCSLVLMDLLEQENKMHLKAGSIHYQIIGVFYTLLLFLFLYLLRIN